jgi:hypothetical protein
MFYGKISGFVKEARGSGNATAMQKITYAASASRESTSSESHAKICRQFRFIDSLNNSRDAKPVRQRHSQPESEIMDSRNIIRSLNEEPTKVRANITDRRRSPLSTTVSQTERFRMIEHAQNLAGKPKFDYPVITINSPSS